MSFFYTPETVEKAKKIDLLTYLENFEPEELVPFSRGTYCTKTHDSLKISNGKWYWFSRGFGGYNALDYLIKVKEIPFIEAVGVLVGKENLMQTNNHYFEEENKISRLILPEKNDNNNIAISYLKSRGIDEEIIQKCIDKGFIYEQKDKHNVVFLGLDSKNNPRYAGLRGTNKTRFMQDASGSDKEFSFRLLSKNNNSSIHVFESAIDLLSYATLLKMSNKDWENENLLALAGVYQPAKDIEESKIPIALKSFLNKNNIKDIYLHFDSDQAGKMATKSLKNQLEKGYNVYDFTPYIGKDYNDFLIETIKNMSKKKEINRESR